MRWRCIARCQVLAVHGLHHLRAAGDPFILAANHGTRREALLVPALLMLHRGGRRVHFLADWSFRLIPGVGLIYSRAEVVTVLGKSARPRFLNALKPLYERPLRPFEQARAHLVAGRSDRHLPRRHGQPRPRPAAARPARGGAAVAGDGRARGADGHSLPDHGARAADPRRTRPWSCTSARRWCRRARRSRTERAPLAAVTEWHAAIMTAIARHSGKTWRGTAEEAVP